MPPFEGNIFQNMPMGPAPIVDMANPAAMLPLDFGRLPGIEPGQLAFPDIFHQMGATPEDGSLANFEDVFKNASNIDFSTPGNEQEDRQAAGLFVNASGNSRRIPMPIPSLGSR